MSLRSFTVTNLKGLKLAECAVVPPLMIICGPNGSGKSTLLSALKQGQAARELSPPDTQILYQPPHRAIRRQTVQRRWLGGQVGSYASMLGLDQVQVFEGMQVPWPQRAPDNVDESGSAIKFVLGKLENRRQTYIASSVDTAVAQGEQTLDLTKMENIFAPLDDVVHRLLPHLKFKSIDFTNEENVRCLFTRTAGSGPSIDLDLDDLSSGEKSVILLFLPLIESEIHARLDKVPGATTPTAAQSSSTDRVFLLDEPELHLHPDLQRRMLAFMRERSATGTVQFVLVTHSPTILDEAGDDELYILRLATTDTSNQLRRVASAGERLNALRELTGESYFVATGRNIVCIEGEPRREGREGASDLSIIEVLHPRANRYTFLAMGSRTQVENAVKRLRAGLPAEQYGVAVAGLVDGDRTRVVAEDVIEWPVCEFENLLLHPDSIVKALGDVGSTSPPSADDVAETLEKVAADRRDEEIRLRVGAELSPVVFRLSGTSVVAITEAFNARVKEVEDKLKPDVLQATIDDAAADVDRALAEKSHLRRFKGKAMLREVFKHFAPEQVSYEQFCYALAQRCKETAEVQSVIDDVFTKLDKVVDKRLADTMLK